MDNLGCKKSRIGYKIVQYQENKTRERERIVYHASWYQTPKTKSHYHQNIVCKLFTHQSHSLDNIHLRNSPQNVKTNVFTSSFIMITIQFTHSSKVRTCFHSKFVYVLKEIFSFITYFHFHSKFIHFIPYNASESPKIDVELLLRMIQLLLETLFVFYSSLFSWLNYFRSRTIKRELSSIPPVFNNNVTIRSRI